MRWVVEQVRHPRCDLMVALAPSDVLVAVSASRPTTLVAYARKWGAEIEWRSEATSAASVQIGEALEGQRQTFELAMLPHGTPFQRAVWGIVREIPFGATRTYGDIAAELGSPQSTRAVGSAVGANPLLLVVPCHRVLGSDGTLTGFSAGLKLKRSLLELEGIVGRQRELFPV